MGISGCHECLSVFIGFMSDDGCLRVSMVVCPKNLKKIWVISDKIP